MGLAVSNLPVVDPEMHFLAVKGCSQSKLTIQAAASQLLIDSLRVAVLQCEHCKNPDAITW